MQCEWLDFHWLTWQGANRDSSYIRAATPDTMHHTRITRMPEFTCDLTLSLYPPPLLYQINSLLTAMKVWLPPLTCFLRM